MTAKLNKDPLDELPWNGNIQPSPETTRTICQNCTRELKPHRPLTAAARIALSLGFILFSIVLLTWFGSGFLLPSSATRAGLLGAVGWSLVNAGVLFFGVARPAGRRCSLATRWVLITSLSVLFLSYLLISASSRLPVEQFIQGKSVAHAISCGLFALVVGAVVSGTILALWRRTDPFTPGLSGALVGLVGGIGSAAAVGLACPSHEAFHLCFSHGFVVITLALAGGLLGRRLLSP